MAEDKNTIEKLEERLEKATTIFKKMEAQMDAKDKEIEALKAQVNDLEDELTLNGGAASEVGDLKARLEKAKGIFTEQKAKIAEQAAIIDEKTKMFEDLQKDLAVTEEQASALSARVAELEGVSSSLYSKIEMIKDIINK